MRFEHEIEDFDSLVTEVDNSNYKNSGSVIASFVDGVKALPTFNRVISTLPSIDLDQLLDTARKTRGGMSGSAKFPWPTDPVEKLSVRWAVCQRIRDGKLRSYDFAREFLGTYSTSIPDRYNDFLYELFDLMAAELLRRVERFHEGYRSESVSFEFALSKEPSVIDQSSSPKIFISHCSKDVALAESIVELLSSSMPLEPGDIRCTSVDGYKLPVGVTSSSELRLEAINSTSFIALVTPTSMQSVFVVFELGARWGTGKNPFILTACGMTPGMLEEPMKSINAKSGVSEPDVHDLLTSVASEIGLQLRPVSSWVNKLNKCLEIATNQAPEYSDSDTEGDSEIAVSETELNPEQCKLLKVMAERNAGSEGVRIQLLCTADLSLVQVQYHLQQLRKRGLVKKNSTFLSSRGTRFSLTTKGIEYVCENIC